jgi:hypothetical protein
MELIKKIFRYLTWPTLILLILVLGAYLAAAVSSRSKLKLKQEANIDKPQLAARVPIQSGQTENILLQKNGITYAVHTGSYINNAFGYKVLIPEGLQGLSTPPPMPQHGFSIDLLNDSGAQIDVQADFNSLFWSSVDQAFEDKIEIVKEEATSIISLQKEATHLSNLQAIRYKVKYKSKDSNQIKIIDGIVAMRRLYRDVDAIYSLTLETPEVDYLDNKKIFEQVINSWDEIPAQ